MKNVHKFDKYSFLWSEVRLLVAAVALFVGGIPVLYFIYPTGATVGLFSALLTISWIASGIASVYLAYRWFKGGKRVFGKKDRMDLIAFFVSVVSGVNLGIVGLGGDNIGMKLAYGNRVIFFIAGAVYLWAAWQLWKSWKAYGKKVF